MPAMLNYDYYLQPIPFISVFLAIQGRIKVINSEIETIMSKDPNDLRSSLLTKLEQERDCLINIRSAVKEDSSATYFCLDDKDYIPYVAVDISYSCDDMTYDKSKHRWVVKDSAMSFTTYRGIIDFDGVYPNELEGREMQIQSFIKARHRTLKQVCADKNKSITTGGKRNMVTTFIEKGDKKVEYGSIIEACKQNCRESGGRVKELNKITVYIKPEDFKAYWALGNLTGSVALEFVE